MNDEATEDRADDLSWTKRASALKRAFWWSGLTLLSAAPLSFLDRDEVLSFFAVFPVPLNALDAGSGHEGPTSPLQVLEEKRLMVTLMVGLVLASGLGGVTIRGRAGVLHLVGHLDLHGLGILLGAQPDVVGLLLGKAQHLGDPFPEGGEVGAVAVRGVCLGLVHLFLELAHLLLQPGDTAL